jgi:hypothetical protein
MSESKILVRRSAWAAALPALAWLTVGATSAAAQPVPLGSAESFAVLGRTSVSNTGASAVIGDVGVGLGGAVTDFPPGTVDEDSDIHEGDAVAVQALQGAAAAFSAIEARTCPAANDLTGQDLGGKSLAPGVYCFDGNAPLTGTLTLTGVGPWTFQIGGLLTVADAGRVVAAGVTSTCTGSSVDWQVGGATATIGAGATFIGNILAQNDVVLGAAASIDGRVVALDGDVTLATNQIAACSNGEAFPPHAPIKVTGGGQLSVPDPDTADHRRGGRGRSTFAFVAIPGTDDTETRGRLVYLNHSNRSHMSIVRRMHVFGRVRNIDVVAVTGTGAPKTVRFDGTCSMRPDCTFSVLVEDNGEGHRDDDDDFDEDYDGDDDEAQGPRDPDHRRTRPRDRFGLVVVANGRIVESRSLRPIARGNIQFHRPRGTILSTDTNDVEFGTGHVMEVTASIDPGAATSPADAYVVLELPNGQLMSWIGSGLVPGLVPIARGLVPFPFEGVVAQLPIPPGAPAGRYTWLSALTESGTLNLMTPISETVFTITP